MTDPVNPPHYKVNASGVECIVVVEHLSFCLGNAVKYLWRAGQKGDLVEDLGKARWYVEREIARDRSEVRLDLRSSSMRLERLGLDVGKIADGMGRDTGAAFVAIWVAVKKQDAGRLEIASALIADQASRMAVRLAE